VTRDETAEDIGEPALDALVRAMKTNDLEARRRAEAILTEIAAGRAALRKAAASSADVENPTPCLWAHPMLNANCKFAALRDTRQTSSLWPSHRMAASLCRVAGFHDASLEVATGKELRRSSTEMGVQRGFLTRRQASALG